MTCVMKTLLKATFILGFDGLCSLGEQATSGQGLAVTLEGTQSDLCKARVELKKIVAESDSWKEARAKAEAMLAESKVRVVMLEETTKALSAITCMAFKEADSAELRFRVLKEYFAKLTSEQDLLISSQERELNDKDSQLAEQAEHMALQRADTIVCLEEFKMKAEDETLGKDTIIDQLTEHNDALLVKVDALERTESDLQDSQEVIDLLTTDLQDLREAAENLEKKANATIETLVLELDAERGVSETLRHDQTRLRAEVTGLRGELSKANAFADSIQEQLSRNRLDQLRAETQAQEEREAALSQQAQMQQMETQLRQLKEALNQAHREAALAAAPAPIKPSSSRSNSPDSVSEESPLVPGPRPPRVIQGYNPRLFAAALGSIGKKDDGKAEPPTGWGATQAVRTYTVPTAGGWGYDNAPPNSVNGSRNDWRVSGAPICSAPPSSTDEGNDSYSDSHRGSSRRRSRRSHSRRGNNNNQT